MAWPAWAGAPAQGSAQSEDPRAAEARKLYEEQRWEDVVRLTEYGAGASPDLYFYRGLALARLERWPEAEAALRAGAAKDPADTRFSRELAGVAFRRGNPGAAKSHLRAVLRKNPRDEYALEFLGTLYLLEGNLEAALELWNQIGKPVVQGAALDPQPRTDPALIGRAFVIPPVGMLALHDFRTTQARLGHLKVFSRYRFELRPRPDEGYTVEFRGVERNGWGANKLDAILSLARGLPYQTVHLEYSNIGGAAMHWVSLARWDAQKRRLSTVFSSPLRGNPKWRWQAHADGRNENWDLRNTLAGGTLPSVNLQKLALDLELAAVESGRWSWRAGAATAYRNFRRPAGMPAAAAPFFTDGFSLRYDAGLNALLWDVPQRRFRLDAGLAAGAGRYFTRPLGGFAGIGASVMARWLPQARGEDFQTQARFQFGRTFGRVTLDELFLLGVERDNDLLLRGHAGTRDGRKGNAPLGRQFTLFNMEFDKMLYSGLLAVKLGPFLDAGRVTDSSGLFGSRGWQWDTGVQMKIGVSGGFEVVLSYGRDLRHGRDAFFARTAR